ncbi:MAG: response regulator transcription factor [Acetivibrionales bacterium]|jgi:two-component system response regulator YesN
MLKALIMDDEPKICELILRLIDWDSLGVSVIGVAYDGQDGFDLLCKERPDIVITDIRMPSLDGLEIIKMTRDKGIDCFFIVISGYQRFEYAQNALKYGVTDYLLKPINKDDLTHTLQKIVSTISEEKARRLVEEQTRNLASFNIKKLRQQFLHDFLNTPSIAERMSVAEINNQYHYNMGNGKFCIVIIKVDYQYADNRDFSQILLGRSEKAFRDIFESSCIEMESIIIGTRLYCFLQADPSESARLKDQIHALADKVENILSSYDSFSLTICPSPLVNDIRDLPACLKFANKAVSYRIVDTKNHISQYANFQSNMLNTLNLSIFYSERHRETLKNLVEVGSVDDIREFLSQIFMPFTKSIFRSYDPDMLYVVCTEVLNTISSTIKTEYLPEDELISFTQVLDEVDNSTSVSSLILRFIESLITALEPYFSNKKIQKSRPVRLAIQYIEKHYREPITLESISSELYLSPTYFSAIFKKETGCSFIEYLTTFRMGIAKKLLRSTNDSLVQIAEQVGYKDAKYFSKVFYKSFGIPPLRYRKL